MCYVGGSDSRISMRALLRQQVEEQSDLCDLTIKNGQWQSKRYHACVLCASPFFQAVMRHNFIESDKGFLELKLGSPELIDTAIMSLYGKYPNLTMDTVHDLINIVHLLQPELKAFCVSWIKHDFKVDEENVENLLHLTSLYDFEIPKLTEYIRQHLIEMLGGNQLLTITADTLENMFLDATLSYVNADVRFEFVMRWVEHSPKQRKSNLGKIVGCIELTEVATGLIEKAKEDKNFKDLQTVIEPETVVKMQNVLITHKYHDPGDLRVFDLSKEEWYRLEISKDDRFKESFTFNSSEHTLCLVGSSDNECKICLHDFKADQSSCTFLRLASSEDLNTRTIDAIYICDKTCYVTSTDIGTIWEGKYTCRKPTLFFGAISECGDETTFTPIISLNINFGVQLVVNEAKCIALFSNENSFLCIYDERFCKIENIDIKHEYYDISPFKDGFVIYGQEKICYIQPRTDSCFEWKSSVYETCLYVEEGSCSLRVVENRWLRFRRKFGDNHEVCLDYTLDEMDRVNVNDVKWKQIPLPNDHVNDSIIRNMLKIEIPHSKLKCHMECPHCRRRRYEQLGAGLYNEQGAGLYNERTTERLICGWNYDVDIYDDNFDDSDEDDYYSNKYKIYIHMDLL